MIDPRAIYNTGIAVTDIRSAQREFERAWGIEWAPILVYDPLRLWTPFGWITVASGVVYSRHGPHHPELIQREGGSLYDHDAIPNAKHMGVRVDAVAPEARRLERLGRKVIAAKYAPGEGYLTRAYLQSPHTSWPVIELVSGELNPMLESWYAEPNEAPTGVADRSA